MDLITNLEVALSAINEAKFQKLINHLLTLDGYRMICSPGSVVGKEKTKKGSPDSFFENDEGYVFVECTTKQKLGKSKSFLDKLKSDIEHCFNEKATKINNAKIVKIILAFNSVISPEEYDLLAERVRDHSFNCKLEIYNIQNIAFKITNYPTLISTYLGINTIKGSIFPLNDFLLKTEKSLQPSLINEFIGRENEMEKCLEVLKTSDRLLLSGGAGVGKSKLAVHILETFEKQDYIPIVIESSMVPLWEDFKSIFNAGKKYIILMDDANKSISNFEYLLTHISEDKPYSIKLVITSRDYVKREVVKLLDNFDYSEIEIPLFKNDEIEKIIISVLPGLNNYFDLRKKIVELAKGNCRLALMATKSATPNSKNKYLETPVLLYDKYFSKVSEEAGILKDPMHLKALALISFFGVLDQNNTDLRTILEQKFNIKWNELWSVIIELHKNELVDLHSNEIVKISDQILGTYAFYKCFIDSKSAEINYGDWIVVFLDKYSGRIQNSLVDVNNTFSYNHVKKMVSSYLSQASKCFKDQPEQRYSFFKLFWFYKERECLQFVQEWISSLVQEENPEKLIIHFENNNHQKASKYFELLLPYLNSPNQFFKISIDLIVELGKKQSSRFPEILKFLNDYITYRVSDVYGNYERQLVFYKHIVKLSEIEDNKGICSGISKSVGEHLLGWHYSDFSGSKGHQFTWCNFNLHQTSQLLELRKIILNLFYNSFDLNEEICSKILNKIVHPGGNIDKDIYEFEITIYQKIINDKLDNKQYLHCKFVKNMAKILDENGISYPTSWQEYIDSEIVKLSRFLRPHWESENFKSHAHSTREKQQSFQKFVSSKSWNEIEKFLYSVNDLRNQQLDFTLWNLDQSITDIFIEIARKNKTEFLKAFHLFCSGKINFTLYTGFISFALNEKTVNANELLRIIDKYNFKGNVFWISAVLALIPVEQINKKMLHRLISAFEKKGDNLYVHSLKDYIKYEKEFDLYKKQNKVANYHNIITFLTSIIISQPLKFRNDLGWDFFSELSSYFHLQKELFGEAYWKMLVVDPHFDYEGKELKAVLDVDNKFINTSIMNGQVGFSYLSPIGLKDVKVFVLWELDNYKILIEDIILNAINTSEKYYAYEEDLSSIFISSGSAQNLTERKKDFISYLLDKHYQNEDICLLLISIVYDNFREWMVIFLEKLFLMHSENSLLGKITFSRSESWTGSRVPLINGKIDFYEDIIRMLERLPNQLLYSDHIEHFEKRIENKKKQIDYELKRDFIEEFY